MSGSAASARSARSVAAAAARTRDWLGDQRVIPATQRALLGEALARLDADAQRLARAADTRPCVGLIVPEPTAGGRILAALASPRDGAAIGRFQGSFTRLPLLDGLLPGGPDRAGHTAGLALALRVIHVDPGDATTAAADHAVRNVLSDDARAKPTPADGSIHVRLVDLADVITILASAWLGNVVAADAEPVTVAVVDALAADVGRETTTAVQAGLSSAEIRSVRAVLERRFPNHPRLTALTTAGYWTAFERLAARVGIEGRRRLASLLWDGFADIEALFGVLAGLLEGLGHASEVTCPIEAVRDPESGPGFGGPHPHSILAAATVLELGRTAPIRVRSRFGAVVHAERALLAVLGAEVAVTVEGEPTAALAGFDVMVLPTACPGVAPRRARRQETPLPQAETATWLARAVLQAKTVHLANQALGAADMTGLIVHVDGRSPVSKAFAPLVSEWVRRTHGATPAEREARETTLIVAVSAAAGEPLSADRVWASLDPAAARATPTDSWAHRWTTDRPFDSVVLLGAGYAPASANETPPPHGVLGAPAASPTLPPPAGLPVQYDRLHTELVVSAREPRTGSWAPHVRDAVVALDEALHTRDGGLRFLAQSIGGIDLARVRRRRIDHRVDGLAVAMRHRLRRHLGRAEEPADQDWRREAAFAVQARLRRTIETGRLGDLIRDLGLDLATARGLFDRLDVDMVTLAGAGAEPDQSPVVILPTAAAADLAGRYARAIGLAWAMRLASRAADADAAEAHALTPALWEAVIDEVLLAAARTDLDARLASRLARMLTRAPVDARRAGDLAGLLATETIGAFVSRLSFDGPWTATHPRRRGTLGAPLFDRVAAGTAPALTSVDAGRIVAQFSADWTDAYLAMVDANLAMASGMRFEGHTQREIEELTALFAPSQGNGRP